MRVLYESVHCCKSPEAEFMNLQCFYYKPVSNHICSGAWGGGGLQNPFVEVTLNSNEDYS